jgi:hypothetical protein
MLRKITALLALALIVACVSAKEYTGNITKIDTDKKLVTVKIDDKEKTFAYTDKTEFLKGDGSAIPQEFLSKLGGKLGDKGRKATVTTDEKDGKEVETDGNAVATKFALFGKKKQ